MIVASISEAKNRLSALVDRVRAGETVVIVDRGVPVARLESVVSVPGDSDGRLARLQRTGALRPARSSSALESLAADPPRPRRGSSAVALVLDDRRRGR